MKDNTLTTEQTSLAGNAKKAWFGEYWRRELKLLRFAPTIICACVWADCTAGELPSPVLVLKGTEDCEVRGKALTRYLLSISNRAVYPDEMFAPAPDLPPVGKNTNASRMSVEIRSSAGQWIYGFAILKSAASLDNLWFTVARGAKPPDKIYVVLHDRRTNVKLTSNQVEMNAGRPSEEPTPSRTAASQRADTPVQPATIVPAAPDPDRKAPVEPIAVIEPPRLLHPGGNAVLPNKGGQDQGEWNFDWSDVPGATSYQLVVQHPAEEKPALDVEVKQSAYRASRSGVVPDALLQGWFWRVRARVKGLWTDWSESRRLHFEPADPRLVMQWVERFRDKSLPAEERKRAIQQLDRLGPSARASASALVEALKDVDLRLSALAALDRIGEGRQTVPTLIEMLKLGGSQRGLAAMKLAIMGPEARQAEPVLLELFRRKDTEPAVRTYAAGALLRMGGHAKEAMPILIEQMRNPSGFLSFVVIGLLRDAGPEAVDAVPVLVRALEDRSSDTRNNAAIGLGNIGPGAKDAVPALLKGLEGNDYTLRENAAKALKVIQPSLAATLTGDKRTPTLPPKTRSDAKPEAPPAAPVDPSLLITKAEAEAVLGCTVVGRVRQVTGSISAYEYRRIEYGAMMADNIEIRVIWDKRAVDTFRSLKAGKHARVELVEGLGDDACWVPQWWQLDILHKNMRLTIRVAKFDVPKPGEKDTVLKERLEAAKSLARKAIDRFPR